MRAWVIIEHHPHSARDSARHAHQASQRIKQELARERDGVEYVSAVSSV